MQQYVKPSISVKLEPYKKPLYLIIESQKAVVTTDFLQIIFVRLAPDNLNLFL